MWKSCYLHQDSNLRPLLLFYPHATHYTTAACENATKKFYILKKYSTFAELTRKWKIPAFLPNYFSGQKGVQVYAGKNKSGLLAEKKPAYGRIKNYGQ